jgi:hypothetical protein
MAEFHLLHEGYLSGTDDDFVGSTASLVRDGDASIVIDPGLVPSRRSWIRWQRSVSKRVMSRRS